MNHLAVSLCSLSLGSRFRFPLDLRLGLVAVWLRYFFPTFADSLARGFLCSDMFVRQFAQIVDRETIRVSRRG